MHVIYHDDVFVVVGEYDHKGYPEDDREDRDVKLYRALDHAEAAAHDMIHMFGATRVRVYRVFADSGNDPEWPFPEWLFGQQLHETIDRLSFDEAAPAAA